MKASILELEVMPARSRLLVLAFILWMMWSVSPGHAQPNPGDVIVVDGIGAILSLPLNCANPCTPTIVKSGIPVVDLAVDPSGNIVFIGAVANPNGSAIFRIPLDCTDACSPTLIKSGPPLVAPTGVAIDPSGNIVVTDWRAQAIFRVSPNGAVTQIPCTSCVTPYSIAIDGQGNYLIADVGARAVLSVTPAGYAIPIKQISPDCVGPCLGQVNRMVIDPSGNIIVTDGRSHAVFRVPSICADLCAPTTIVKSGPPLVRPYGVGVDARGNIIVSDLGAHAIFSIAPNCANACSPTIIKSGPPLVAPFAIAIVPPSTTIPEYPRGPLIALAGAFAIFFLVRRRIQRVKRIFSRNDRSFFVHSWT